ncbi:MAG: hypothetical protein JW840_08640 [Candidatus Thermoplasmatota archaeon]|nr:hypothetical protein [Candidatus Thermoplasmatota archaeon]
MKKLIPIVIVGLVVLCGLQAVAAPLDLAESKLNTWKILQQEQSFFPDDLDQSQELMNWIGPVGSGPLWGYANYIIAQSFTPTKNLLTRVEIMVGKNATTTYDITLTIRDDLHGADLATLSLPASAIVTENFSWTEFDVSDLVVTPGATYYIVASTANVTENWYIWALYMNGSSYMNGTIYYSVDDEVTWTEEPGGDLTFRTYGSDATMLNLTIAGGLGVSVNAKNVGGINAVNVVTTVTIQGGIFGLINATVDGNISLLMPAELQTVKGMPLGLGPLSVVATTRADNAEEVTKTADGFILLFFVIIK